MFLNCIFNFVEFSHKIPIKIPFKFSKNSTQKLHSEKSSIKNSSIENNSMPYIENPSFRIIREEKSILALYVLKRFQADITKKNIYSDFFSSISQ